MLTAALALLTLAVPCLDNDAPGCVVDVQVDHSPLQLQVDSGADITMLTMDAARRAGIRIDNDAPIIIMRGVAGRTYAILTRVTIAVGPDKAESVLIAISPVGLGRSDGLLGMSFLERYRFGLENGQLRLQPIDAGETPRPGGHGKSWWRLRFRQTRARLRNYEATADSAREMDERTRSEFGVDPSGMTASDLVARLKRLQEEDLAELNNHAAQNDVPIEWRR